MASGEEFLIEQFKGGISWCHFQSTITTLRYERRQNKCRFKSYAGFEKFL